MALFGPFVHRRRKQLSLDGMVPGVEYSHYQGGVRYASIPGNYGRIAGAGRSPEDYDPITAVYPTAREYDQPGPADEIAFEPRTPPMRLELPPRPPEAISYDDAHMNDILFEHAMDGALTSMGSVEAPEQIPVDHEVRLNPLPPPGPDWSDIRTPNMVFDAAGTSYAGLFTGPPDLKADDDMEPEEALPGLEAIVGPAGMLEATPDVPTYDEAAVPGPESAAPSLEEVIAQLDLSHAMPEPEPPNPVQAQYDMLV